MIGATFDSGVLIALERRNLGMVIKLRVLHQAGTVESMSEALAKAAGEALGSGIHLGPTSRVSG